MTDPIPVITTAPMDGDVVPCGAYDYPCPSWTPSDATSATPSSTTSDATSATHHHGGPAPYIVAGLLACVALVIATTIAVARFSALLKRIVPR